MEVSADSHVDKDVAIDMAVVIPPHSDIDLNIDIDNPACRYKPR